MRNKLPFGKEDLIVTIIVFCLMLGNNIAQAVCLTNIKHNQSPFVLQTQPKDFEGQIDG